MNSLLLLLKTFTVQSISSEATLPKPVHKQQKCLLKFYDLLPFPIKHKNVPMESFSEGTGKVGKGSHHSFSMYKL